MPGNPAPAQIATEKSAAQRFVDELAQATGLDPRVIEAWVSIEGAGAPGGTGGNNYLNVRAKGARGYSGVPIPTTSQKGFAQFYSVDDAVKETAYWINHMSNYGTIRSSTHLGPKSQLAAIAASPWDAGHYGGGRKLYDAYASIIKPGGHFLGIDWGAVNTYFDPGGGAGFADPAKPVIKAAHAAESTAQAVGDAASFAFNPNNWLRIGFIIGGGVMVLLGAVLLAKSVGALTVTTPSAPNLNLDRKSGGGPDLGSEFDRGVEQGEAQQARAAGRSHARSSRATVTGEETPESVRAGRLRSKTAAIPDKVPF